MANPVGFLELERVEQKSENPEERVNHYKEFVKTLSEKEAGRQASRCMDCGTPFCNNGCPVNNVIPDFNSLVMDQIGKRLWKFYIALIIFLSSQEESVQHLVKQLVR